MITVTPTRAEEAEAEKNRRCYEACGFRGTGRRMKMENGKLTLACCNCSREEQKCIYESCN